MSAVQTSDQHLLVLVTAPDRDLAKRMAQSLVQLELAACAQVLPAIESHYRWNGKVESSQEHLLLIKTLRSRWERLALTIRAEHPYEVPQIVAIPITDGLDAYLAWVSASVGGSNAVDCLTRTTNAPVVPEDQQI